jgi:hypothetical protein
MNLTKLARAWWYVTTTVRMLWICRAALLPVIVGIALIGWADQARDIVVADAVPSLRNWPRMVAILVAVGIWAFVAWYWARVMVQYSYLNPRPTLPADLPWHARLTTEVPRVIGMVAMLSVAAAFWEAHKLYAYADDPKARLFLGMACVYVAVALAFYLVVRKRTAIMQWFVGKGASPKLLPNRAQSDRIFDPQYPFTLIFLLLTLAASPLFYWLVRSDPVGMGDGFFWGAVPAALVGFALTVPVNSVLVMLSARSKFPFFGFAVALLIAIPIMFGDFHDVRTIRVATAGDKRLTCDEQDRTWSTERDRRRMLKEAYSEWWDFNAGITDPIAGSTKAPPLVMVATAGGASRAAFFTSQVLGEIAARERNFPERLFMISGVSGGSLGAVTFRSIVEADRRANPDRRGSPLLKNAAKDGRTIIENDFLGPTFAAGLYVDLPSNGLSFLPRSLLPDDRGVALEKAWEAAWAASGLGKGHFGWDNGFVATFGGAHAWPFLALNGTSVEKGKRIITSNVQFWSPTAGAANMSGGINRYDTFDITKADIPISTSVTMSARFPVISPTGALRDCKGTPVTRVTDGGLFENFGALTLDEILRFLVFRVKDVQEAREGKYQAVPMVILISSDPSLDRLHLREDGRPSDTPVDCAPVKGDHSPKPEAHPGNGWKECPSDVSQSASLLGDPVTALYDGRVARGEAAATALLDRIMDSRIPLQDRLTDAVNKDKRNPPIGKEVVQRRIGTDDHRDFFHFRQCRVLNRRGPTMSWHDSAEAWDVLRAMLGLEENSRDDCGNRAEFFRLCTRLERITTGVNDKQATETCATRWPVPADWKCTEVDGRWFCRPD